MKEKFHNYISDCIKNEKSIDYEWKKDNTEIIFKKKAEDGFDIIVRLENDIIYLESDKDCHKHFHIKGFKDIEKAMEITMEFVRNMLSKNMRIKELLSNGKPYKYLLQKFYKNRWKTESSGGLLFWNYFGKRSERIYSNDILPPSGN
ncbi:MAG: hypothetical protein ABIH18_07450 [Candidatus Omnitrophota bacterium]